MLDWLRKRMERSGKGSLGWPGATAGRAAARNAGRPLWRVTFDDNAVVLTDPNGTVSRLGWADLASVGIITTPDGPASPDLFWILHSTGRSSPVVVPMGAEGEHDLLVEMQRRLLGFDNMTVVEAMSSTDASGFVVWSLGDIEPEPPAY